MDENKAVSKGAKKNARIKMIGTGVLLLGIGCLFLMAISAGISHSAIEFNDFIAFWAAGRVFLQGGNPYDIDQIASVQRAVGCSVPTITWVVPSTVFIESIIALFPYPVAFGLWFLLSVICIIFCGEQLWTHYGGGIEGKSYARLFAISFMPGFFLLNVGQITALALAGVTGFLFCLKHERPKLAGACLALLTVKPLVSYLIWLFLLLSSYKKREWKVAGTAALLLVPMNLAVLLKDSAIFESYFQLVNSPKGGPLALQTPTLGMILRMAIDPEARQIQLIPTIIGCVIAILLWLRWKNDFNWNQMLPGILLLSVITCLHGWTFDWIVLMPIAMLIAIWFSRNQAANKWLMIGYLFSQAVLLVQFFTAGNYIYTAWMPIAMMLLYYIGKRKNEAVPALQATLESNHASP